MTETKVISRLLEWSPIVFDGLVLSRQRCILTTRVGLDVLAAFGIAAEPRPCVACVANAPYVLWKDDQESRSAPTDAWAVWAGLPSAPDDPVQPGKGWAGHLVVFLPTRSEILDLDFQQFRRPAKLLDTPPAIVASWPTGDQVAHFIGRDGQRRLFVVRYERTDDNDGYMVAPDWRRERPFVRDTVATLVRMIRKGSPTKYAPRSSTT